MTEIPDVDCPAFLDALLLAPTHGLRSLRRLRIEIDQTTEMAKTTTAVLRRVGPQLDALQIRCQQWYRPESTSLVELLRALAPCRGLTEIELRGVIMQVSKSASVKWLYLEHP